MLLIGFQSNGEMDVKEITKFCRRMRSNRPHILSKALILQIVTLLECVEETAHLKACLVDLLLSLHQVSVTVLFSASFSGYYLSLVKEIVNFCWKELKVLIKQSKIHIYFVLKFTCKVKFLENLCWIKIKLNLMSCNVYYGVTSLVDTTLCCQPPPSNWR